MPLEDIEGKHRIRTAQYRIGKDMKIVEDTRRGHQLDRGGSRIVGEVTFYSPGDGQKQEAVNKRPMGFGIRIPGDREVRGLA